MQCMWSQNMSQRNLGRIPSVLPVRWTFFSSIATYWLNMPKLGAWQRSLISFSFHFPYRSIPLLFIWFDRNLSLELMQLWTICSPNQHPSLRQLLGLRSVASWKLILVSACLQKALPWLHNAQQNQWQTTFLSVVNQQKFTASGPYIDINVYSHERVTQVTRTFVRTSQWVEVFCWLHGTSRRVALWNIWATDELETDPENQFLAVPGTWPLRPAKRRIERWTWRWYWFIGCWFQSTLWEVCGHIPLCRSQDPTTSEKALRSAAAWWHLRRGLQTCSQIRTVAQGQFLFFQTDSHCAGGCCGLSSCRLIITVDSSLETLRMGLTAGKRKILLASTAARLEVDASTAPATGANGRVMWKVFELDHPFKIPQILNSQRAGIPSPAKFKLKMSPKNGANMEKSQVLQLLIFVICRPAQEKYSACFPPWRSGWFASRAKGSYKRLLKWWPLSTALSFHCVGLQWFMQY